MIITFHGTCSILSGQTGQIIMIFTTFYVMCSLIAIAEGRGRLTLTLKNYKDEIEMSSCGDCKVTVSIQFKNGETKIKNYETKAFELTERGVKFQQDSKDFVVTFDFDEWSGTLTYDISLLRIDSSGKKNVFKQFIRTIKLQINGPVTFVKHELEHGGPSISFTVQVECYKHYFGQCNKYCKSRNTMGDGHYTCSENGDKICNEGWKGVDCKTKSICAGNKCKNGGTCDEENTMRLCLCTPWYMGYYCTKRKSACKVLEKCQNGATCVNIGYSDRYCVCKKGYRGMLCELKISPCDRQPCKKSLNCSDEGTEDFKCQCITGYMGKSCDVDINECTNVPEVCKNNATCVNTIGSYHCTCATGYIGKHCDQCMAHLLVNGRCRPDLELSDTDMAWVLLVSFSLITSALLSYIFLFVRTLWSAPDPGKQ